MTAWLDSALDIAIGMLCLYVMVVGIWRIKMMHPATHRRPWIAIYFLLTVSAFCSLLTLAEGAVHWRLAPFFGYLATAMWFHESRDRWKGTPPDYMLRTRQ